MLFLLLFFSLLPQPPRSTLFPYTTLFRSTSAREIAQHRSFGAARHSLRARVFSLPDVPPLPHRPVENTRARSECRARSEEHTSELQSQSNLVCRLLLEKKKKN